MMNAKTMDGPNSDTRDHESDAHPPGEKFEGKFGWCGFEPTWLQFMNNPFGFLVIFSIILVTQGMLVSGIYGVIITTLEQRFGFTSSEIGVLTAGYEAGSLVFILFITFYANRGHRPRLMALGSILFGLGAFLFSIPHFATDPYEYGEQTTNWCHLNKTTEECPPRNENLRSYFYLFLFAMVLEGIGTIPFFTVSYSFIEDSLPKNKSPLYLGWANAMTLLGAVIGYGLGGYILTIYVDFDFPGVIIEDRTPEDPRWAGAWWIGHLLAASLFLIVIMIAMFGFPRQFPGSAKIQASRKPEYHAKSGIEVTAQNDFGKSINDMPRAIMALVKNPTYFFAVIGGCMETFIISSYTAFLPKIIENQYNISPSYAALYTGAITIPGGVFGSLLSGVVVSRFKLTTPQLLKMCISLVVAVFVLLPIGFYHCSEPDISGVTVDYVKSNDKPLHVNLTSQCNSNCNCAGKFFTPVCGGNSSYFSACHAGCTSYNRTSGTFFNCSCAENKEMGRGLCTGTCSALFPFVAVFFVITLADFALLTPAQLVILRCVPDGQRSFAAGVQLFALRVFAFLGPLSFGAIFDAACLLWEEQTCPPGTGSCYIYKSNQIAISLVVVSMSFKVLSGLFYTLALRFYETPDEAIAHKMGRLSHIHSGPNKDDGKGALETTTNL